MRGWPTGSPCEELDLAGAFEVRCNDEDEPGPLQYLTATLMADLRDRCVFLGLAVSRVIMATIAGRLSIRREIFENLIAREL